MARECEKLKIYTQVKVQQCRLSESQFVAAENLGHM